MIDPKAVFIGVSGVSFITFPVLVEGKNDNFHLTLQLFSDFGKEEVINFLFLVSALQINGT